MLKPVVCFYKDDLLIISTDYSVITSSKAQPTTAFLQQIHLQYQNQMKIVQINFEHESTVTVYVLNQYELKSKNELTCILKNIEILFKPDIAKKSFLDAVTQIKQDISQGRYYQVNFTSSFSSVHDHNYDSFELFKYYLGQFQSPFSAFLPNKADQSEILCYSPELFLEKINSAIKTQPIKGTTQARENFDHLLNNEKENAELSMIVDLLRNDLQSVCENKVTVPHHREALHLNYVTHTYSEICGTTKMGLPEILQNMLPAGSISGCPKKESLKAIYEYEKTPRGFYTGCIGWWQNDNFKLNLAIRSFENKKNKLKYYSGCGIVYDSDPQKEWQEFQNKAKHLKMIKVVDTLKISEDENPNKAFHLQRSFEAAHLLNSNITFSDIEKIYDSLPIVTEDQKCRIQFNPFDLHHIEIELSAIDPIDSEVQLQIAKNHNQTLGLGLQNYKTNQRQYWIDNSGKYEVLGLNTTGFITETARFNIFLKLNDQVFTPSLLTGCINGIYRRQALQKKKIEIKGQFFPLTEKDFRPDEISGYEIYLGNSLRGLHKARLVTDE